MPPAPRRMLMRARDASRALWSDGRGWILSSIAFGWLLLLGSRLAIPALVPPVRAEFGIDLTTVGVLLTLLWLGYAAGQFPGGILADRFGERNLLVASMGLSTATVAAIALSTGLLSFAAGAVLFGLVTGLYATTRFTTIADVYPDRDATALGITSAAGNVGTTVIPIAAGVLAAYAGWRSGFGALVPFFVVTVIGLWVFVPRRTSETPDGGSGLSVRTLRRLLGVLSRRPITLGTGTMLLMSFVYQAFTSFYPTYLVTQKGVSQPVAATLFGLFFGSAILIQPMSGAASDRFGTRRMLVALTVVPGIALVAFPLAEGLPALVGLTVLASVQLGFWPVVQGYVIGALPDDIQGSGFGLVRTAYLIVAAAGPATVGALADAGRFDGALVLLGAVVVATAALWWRC